MEGEYIATGYAMGIATMAWFAALTPRMFTRKQFFIFAGIGLAMTLIMYFTI